jgi:hypothetical protein
LEGFKRKVAMGKRAERFAGGFVLGQCSRDGVVERSRVPAPAVYLYLHFPAASSSRDALESGCAADLPARICLLLGSFSDAQVRVIIYLAKRRDKAGVRGNWQDSYMEIPRKVPSEYNSVMGKSCNGSRAALVLAIVLALGCKEEKPLLVNVAPGYSGAVTISCVSYGDDLQTITIDSSGRDSSGACPVRRTELLVMRNGKAIPTDGPVNWESTGDGFPVNIQFTIR